MTFLSSKYLPTVSGERQKYYLIHVCSSICLLVFRIFLNLFLFHTLLFNGPSIFQTYLWFFSLKSSSLYQLTLSNTFFISIKHKHPLYLYLLPSICISPTFSLVPLPFLRPNCSFPTFSSIILQICP